MSKALQITNGHSLNVGNKVKLSTNLSTRVFEVVKENKYEVEIRYRIGRTRKYVYSTHLRKEKIFKVIEKKLS